MEKPVVQVSQEHVQFWSAGVNQLGPGPAQHGPAEPERQAGGHRGRQGAGEAEEPGDGEDEPLLSARHGGMEAGRLGVRLQEPGEEDQRRASSPQTPHHSLHLRPQNR